MSLLIDPRFPYHSELGMPSIGVEAEFKVFVDGEEVLPETYWRTPRAFLGDDLLKRGSRSFHLPAGGAVYFDGGVIEFVTPVIEIASGCSARAARSLWEQIGYARGKLDEWEEKRDTHVRLQAFSCHVNVSFELSREERRRNRTVQKLAVLLMHILPPAAMLVGLNRRSTGIGVRPRRDRIEITLDFNPDPQLSAALLALIVGVVRTVMSWNSYLLEEADCHGVPVIAGLTPGKHPTRKGWIARREHFPEDPFAIDRDDVRWTLRDGRVASLRTIALETARVCERMIRQLSDASSHARLFSVLRGESASLLDLEDRPSSYDDVGRGEYVPPRMSRSAYERVFRNLARRRPLTIDAETLIPVNVRGWYHAIFRNTQGEERMLSIDQLLEYW